MSPKFGVRKSSTTLFDRSSKLGPWVNYFVVAHLIISSSSLPSPSVHQLHPSGLRPRNVSPSPHPHPRQLPSNRYSLLSTSQFLLSRRLPSTKGICHLSSSSLQHLPSTSFSRSIRIESPGLTDTPKLVSLDVSSGFAFGFPYFLKKSWLPPHH